MGLGSKEVRRKIYYCQPKSVREISTTENGSTKTRKFVDPRIEIVTRNGEGGPLINLPEEKKLSGYLLDIGDGSYTWENRTIQKIWFTLVDGNDAFKIEFSLNTSMARNVIQLLLSTIEYGWIEFRVYLQKGKDGKGDNAGVFMASNREALHWRFEYKESEDDTVKALHDASEPYLVTLVDEGPDPQDPSKKVKIYHRLNKFLIDAWRVHKQIVAGNAKALGLESSNPPPPGPPKAIQQAEQREKAAEAEEHRKLENGDQPPIGEEPPPPMPDDDLPF